MVDDVAGLHHCCYVVFHRSEALKASTAQMHYGNASNPCALSEQVILNFFPQQEKPATSRAKSTVELFAFDVFHMDYI